MDLHHIIRELHKERDRLEQAIRASESLLMNEARGGIGNKPKRRGPKRLSQREEAEALRRVRRYWEARRK